MRLLMGTINLLVTDLKTSRGILMPRTIEGDLEAPDLPKRKEQAAVDRDLRVQLVVLLESSTFKITE